jgi:hypothetical protein
MEPQLCSSASPRSVCDPDFFWRRPCHVVHHSLRPICLLMHYSLKPYIFLFVIHSGGMGGKDLSSTMGGSDGADTGCSMIGGMRRAGMRGFTPCCGHPNLYNRSATIQHFLGTLRSVCIHIYMSVIVYHPVITSCSPV